MPSTCSLWQLPQTFITSNHGLDTRFLNFKLHQNHLEDVLGQKWRDLTTRLWCGRSGVEPENCQLKQVPETLLWDPLTIQTNLSSEEKSKRWVRPKKCLFKASKNQPNKSDRQKPQGRKTGGQQLPLILCLTILIFPDTETSFPKNSRLISVLLDAIFWVLIPSSIPAIRKALSPPSQVCCTSTSKYCTLCPSSSKHVQSAWDIPTAIYTSP